MVWTVTLDIIMLFEVVARLLPVIWLKNYVELVNGSLTDLIKDLKVISEVDFDKATYGSSFIE